MTRISESKTPMKVRLNKNLKMKRSPETKEIAKLRETQKVAIAAMDFDTAEEISKQIENIRTFALDAYLNPVKDSLSEDVRTEIADYFMRTDNIRQTKQDRILDHRREMSLEFDKTKSKHIKQLVDLETEFETMRMKEAQRTTPEYEEMIKQAKDAAAVGAFDDARSIQDHAIRLHEQEIERKMIKIDEELKVQTDIIISGQREELERLVKKFNDGILLIENKEKNELQRELEVRDSRLVGYVNKAAKRLVAEAPSGYTDYVVCRRILSNFMVEILASYEIEIPKEVLAYNPKTSVRNASRKPTPRKGTPSK